MNTETMLATFRAELDDFMEFHPQSPLSDEQREAFEGLSYYAYDPALVFDLTAERLGDDEPSVQMETSTGDQRLYRRWGVLRFEVDGEEAALTVYSEPDGHGFFAPFRDATSGDETYGAGRYLDDQRPGLKRTGEDTFQLDFNFAYNPYCAYSPHYSCPLPPRDNWLKVPIWAGEKAFE